MPRDLTDRKVEANGPVKADAVPNAHSAVATALPLFIMLCWWASVEGPTTADCAFYDVSSFCRILSANKAKYENNLRLDS